MATIADQLEQAEAQFLHNIDKAIDTFTEATGCYITNVHLAYDRNTREYWGGSISFESNFVHLPEENLEGG
jgi:hypothetical protein